MEKGGDRCFPLSLLAGPRKAPETQVWLKWFPVELPETNSSSNTADITHIKKQNKKTNKNIKERSLILYVLGVVVGVVSSWDEIGLPES